MRKKSRGWLANPKRRSRRDRSQTFTNKDAEKLINRIDQMPNYISKIFGSTLDSIMRARDKALIALAWTFFKRGGEVLKLKRKDVDLTEKEIIVTFSVSKKKKRFKVCPECETKNGFRSKFCRECNRNLLDVAISEEGGELIVTKRKVLTHKFVRYVLEWIKKFDFLTENFKNRGEALLFPPLRVVFSRAYFDFFSKDVETGEDKPMTIQNFDKILQRLDPNMTSCLFRYGGSEKYLALGYTPHELKEIGDWESSYMPEVYAKRKGITPTQRRWSEDVR